MSSKPVRMPAQDTKFFAFNGGLDLVTPPVEMSSGALRSASNMEIGINGGYTRIGGYERYSGKAKPSAAIYAILTCTITGSVALGDVLTDNAGTSFGTVIALPTGQAVLTRLTGTFSTGNIKVGATVVGTCVGEQQIAAAATPALNASYRNLAADVYRALIAVVPGSGSILGVHQYNGSVYAFRNNAGATAAVMHVSSASGWTPVTLGEEISFSNANTSVGDGDTLTQGAVTATVSRVVVQTGTLLSGVNTGRLILAGRSGGNFAAGAATSSGGGALTLSGAQSAITLLPGGRYEFDNWNFGGGTGTKKMYGCNGVNRGFEFDGTTFVPIATGMATDAPTHLKAHKNQLFFSFAGSAQHSGIGTPYAWSAVSGAAELACGDNITGFLGLAGSETSAALGIYTRNRTLVLYGNSPADWNLVPYSEEAGALPYTIQFVGQGVTLDDQGITLLATTQNYGNFQNAVVSDKITPYLNDLTITAQASCIVRRKNQYRLFFSGGDAVYMTFKSNKIMGMTPISMPDPVMCISSAEGASGQEEIYFGSTDGYVYQMDIGTSFDGDRIAWHAELAFNHFGGPRQLKTFRKGVTEVTGSAYCEFSFSYSLGYGSTEFDASTSEGLTSALAGTNWDSFVWDQFFWDGRTLLPTEADITGTAENIALMFSGNSDEFESFTLNSEIIHYTTRRSMR